MEAETAIKNGLAYFATAMRQEVDAIQVKAYLHGLKTIAGDVITEASERLMREPGRRFFPTVPEWVGVCALVIDERRKHATRIAETLRHECGVCAGSGWKPVVIHGIERETRCKCWIEGRSLVEACGQPLRQIASGQPDEGLAHG